MKFRGSQRIMGLLKEHEAILDISSQLTVINCQVDEMKDISITRQSPDVGKLREMMKYHQMSSVRQQKWLGLIKKNNHN